MKVKVTASVTISMEGALYRKDDVFEIPEKHYAGISHLVQVLEEAPTDGQATEDKDTEETDKDLTVAEIKKLLDNAGISYKKSAKKSELLAFLNE